ncbi:site-specific integrase [Candidatus Bathyarchaeota archaeon]|nr:site-specific integrase [Candidatus Bathyarchaeota archaeon]
MPIIKVKRSDILRKPEIDNMLNNAASVYNGVRLQCIIALAWLFGKRINEILQLKRQDIRKDTNFLYVRFHVSKKKTRKDAPLPKPFLKRIRLQHPYVHYILDWIVNIKEGYIFPSYGQPRTIHVKLKNKETGEILKVYEYHKEGGYLSDARVKQLLRLVNPNAWWHLFRESLATYMAERGATEEELMHWFDWDRVSTAHEYVKRGTKLTEKWSEREW